MLVWLRISGALMRNILVTALFFSLTAVSCMPPTAAAQSSAPLRIAIAGLVHGHVGGFLRQNLHRSDVQLVGVAEPDQKLAATIASQFSLPQDIFFASVEEMLTKTKPQAVLIYTNTYDHRSVVEICARQGIPVMMEKPLAVSLEDARAIKPPRSAARSKSSSITKQRGI